MALTIQQIQDNITAKKDAREIINQLADYIQANPSGGGAASYLVYTALLTQIGTSAPTATVLENTLGGTVVWGYLGQGTYTATLSGAFTENKTAVIISGLAGGFAYATRDSANVITLTVQDDSVTPSDEYLFETTIEIRVYP